MQKGIKLRGKLQNNVVTLFKAKIKNNNRCKVPKQQNYNPPSLHLFTFEMGRCT